MVVGHNYNYTGYSTTEFAKKDGKIRVTKIEFRVTEFWGGTNVNDPPITEIV